MWLPDSLCTSVAQHGELELLPHLVDPRRAHFFRELFRPVQELAEGQQPVKESLNAGLKQFPQNLRSENASGQSDDEDTGHVG